MHVTCHHLFVLSPSSDVMSSSTAINQVASEPALPADADLGSPLPLRGLPCTLLSLEFTIPEGPSTHRGYGLWNQKAQVLGTWTLWACCLPHARAAASCPQCPSCACAMLEAKPQWQNLLPFQSNRPTAPIADCGLMTSI